MFAIENSCFSGFYLYFMCSDVFAHTKINHSTNIVDILYIYIASLETTEVNIQGIWLNM